MAIDTDTGRVLSPEEEDDARDNPNIYRWVKFID